MEFVDISDTRVKIVCKDAYKLKEGLKKNGCKWDDTLKCWTVENTKTSAIENVYFEYVDEQEEKGKRMWKQACKDCNVPFARKGTPEYDKVKSKFIQLMRD
jgi:hypothetical protein